MPCHPARLGGGRDVGDGTGIEQVDTRTDGLGVLEDVAHPSTLPTAPVAQGRWQRIWPIQARRIGLCYVPGATGSPTDGACDGETRGCTVEELRFDGRSVIVTGGGRGFGRCHSLLLASRGARVVVADYGVEMDGSGSSSEPAEQVVAEIKAAGGEAVALFANVADEAGAAKIVQTALDSFGKLDVLVNNAGIYAGNLFEDVDAAQFRRMVEFHYLGTVNMCREALPHLKAAEHGSIVNTASEAVIGHIPKSSDYAGAKGAVFSFTKALALNLIKDGLRVNTVAPHRKTRACPRPRCWRTSTTRRPRISRTRCSRP